MYLRLVSCTPSLCTHQHPKGYDDVIDFLEMTKCAWEWFVQQTERELRRCETRVTIIESTGNLHLHIGNHNVNNAPMLTFALPSMKTAISVEDLFMPTFSPQDSNARSHN